MNFDRGFIEKVLTRGVDRLPCLEEAEVNPKRAWAGLYEMTPDHHPVLGPVKELSGFFLANGFSGHGVMHSPATGRIMADLILRGQSDLVGTGLLGLDRFAAGRLLHEAVW
jgi:sarcosine oxidase subunit beta